MLHAADFELGCHCVHYIGHDYVIMIVFRVEAEKPVHPFNYIHIIIHKQK